LSLQNPGAGVDLVSVDEVAQSIARFGASYLTRVYTETERWQTRGRANRLAGRFAAKEAVFKALGAGDQPFVWTDIEVLEQQGAPPDIRLRGAAAQRAESSRIGGWVVSITHDERTAAAMVVARPMVRTGD
jgi:holo-[acyl-carrier protein] synthase